MQVKYWVTFNEIHIWTTFAYAFGYHAPGIVDKPDINPYIATKNCLLAHALAYRSYDKDFREKQKGLCITIRFHVSKKILNL